MYSLVQWLKVGVLQWSTAWAIHVWVFSLSKVDVYIFPCSLYSHWLFFNCREFSSLFKKRKKIYIYTQYYTEVLEHMIYFCCAKCFLYSGKCSLDATALHFTAAASILLLQSSHALFLSVLPQHLFWDYSATTKAVGRHIMLDHLANQPLHKAHLCAI